MPTWAWVLNLGLNMNIELEEVVQDVSDDALELAAGGGALGPTHVGTSGPQPCTAC